MVWHPNSRLLGRLGRYVAGRIATEATDEQTNELTNRQTDAYRRCVKHYSKSGAHRLLLLRPIVALYGGQCLLYTKKWTIQEVVEVDHYKQDTHTHTHTHSSVLYLCLSLTLARLRHFHHAGCQHNFVVPAGHNVLYTVYIIDQWNDSHWWPGCHRLFILDRMPVGIMG